MISRFIGSIVLVVVGMSSVPALAAQFGGYLTSEADVGVSLFGEAVLNEVEGRSFVAGLDLGGRSYTAKGADDITRLVIGPYIGTETPISPSLSLAYRLGVSASLAGDKTDYGFISNKVFFKMRQDPKSESRQISGLIAGWELTINGKQPELNGTQIRPIDLAVFLGTVY